MKRIFLTILAVLVLAGCATSVRYVNYTEQKFPSKDKYYLVNIYPLSQQHPLGQPYYVIGKVEISGFASDGVSPESLADQAKRIARKRGADAIINARTQIARYGWLYGPYRDTVLRFTGELIIFTPEVSK